MRNFPASRILAIFRYYFFWKWVRPKTREQSRSKVASICEKEKPHNPEELMNYKP